MSIGEWIALSGLFMQLLAMISCGIWVVASLRTSGAKLDGTMIHIGKTMDRLDQTIRSVEDRQNDHEMRVRILESRTSQ